MNIETEMTRGIRDDLFAAIKYEKRQGSNGTVFGLQLGPHFVFKSIVEESWKYISAGIVTADSGIHTTESLFNNPAVWDGYDEENQQFQEIARLNRLLKYSMNDPRLKSRVSGYGSSRKQSAYRPTAPVGAAVVCTSHRAITVVGVGFGCQARTCRPSQQTSQRSHRNRLSAQPQHP